MLHNILSSSQVVEATSDHDDLLNSVCEAPFTDKSLVMWRARLLPHGSKISYPVTDIKDKFPYQYSFIYVFHHALGDGLDGAFMLQCFGNILNDVIAERTISEEELSEFTDKTDLHILRQKVIDTLAKDQNRISLVRTTVPPPDHTPLLLTIFPKPDVTKRTTRHVTRIVNSSVLQPLQLKVQEMAVSFNSCLMALINVAIVEMAQKAGKEHTSYVISANILGSLRRYLKYSRKFQIGPFNMILSHSSNVDTNGKKYFWDYCKKLHEEVRSSLKSGLALEQAAVKEMDHPDKPVDEYFTNPLPVTHDYGISNLGTIPGTTHDEHVQMTQAFSVNMVHRFIHSNLHQIFIFRSQCYYTISYDTYYFSEESVNIIIDSILCLMETVTKLPLMKASL